VNANDAISLLKANVAHPSHRFWRDEIGFVEAAKPFAARITFTSRLRMLTCWGLAVLKKGKLLTLDPGMRFLAGAAMIGRRIVEIL
jgi:hypothetical protein